jgi:hypothetical protein
MAVDHALEELMSTLGQYLPTPEVSKAVQGGANFPVAAKMKSRGSNNSSFDCFSVAKKR